MTDGRFAGSSSKPTRADLQKAATLHLRYRQKYGTRETARILGLPSSTVHDWLQKGPQVIANQRLRAVAQTAYDAHQAQNQPAIADSFAEVATAIIDSDWELAERVFPSEPDMEFADAPDAAAPQHTGCMIAWRIPSDIASLIALPQGYPGATPPEEFHITLAYLGEAADIDVDALTQVVGEWASMAAPVGGELSGTGSFVGGDEARYVSFDGPTAPGFRQSLVQRLVESDFPVSMSHGWTPHVTVGLGPGGLPHLIQPIPLTFTNVSVVAGGEWTDIDLTGDRIFEFAESAAKTSKPSKPAELAPDGGPRPPKMLDQLAAEAWHRFLNLLANDVPAHRAVTACEKIDPDFAPSKSQIARALHVVGKNENDPVQFAERWQRMDDVLLLANWSAGTVAPPAYVTNLYDQYEMAQVDVADFSLELREMAQQSYLAGLNSQLAALGRPAVQAITDQQILTAIQQDAQQMAEQIADTYNKDLGGAVYEAWIDGLATRGRQMSTYHLDHAVSEWSERRVGWKSSQVADTESTKWYNAAVKDFAERNASALPQAQFYVTPDGCQCDYCREVVRGNPYTASEAAALKIPAHPNCVHALIPVYQGGEAAGALWQAQNYQSDQISASESSQMRARVKRIEQWLPPGEAKAVALLHEPTVTDVVKFAGTPEEVPEWARPFGLAEPERVAHALQAVAHDVSDELRDPTGRWTKGGAIPAVHPHAVPSRARTGSGLGQRKALPKEAAQFIAGHAQKFFAGGGTVKLVGGRDEGLLRESLAIDDLPSDNGRVNVGRTLLASAVHRAASGLADAKTEHALVAYDKDGHLAAALDFHETHYAGGGGIARVGELGSSHLPGSEGAATALEYAIATWAAQHGESVSSTYMPDARAYHRAIGRQLVAGKGKRSFWDEQDCQDLAEQVKGMVGVAPDFTPGVASGAAPARSTMAERAPLTHNGEDLFADHVPGTQGWAEAEAATNLVREAGKGKLSDFHEGERVLAVPPDGNLALAVPGLVTGKGKRLVKVDAPRAGRIDHFLLPPQSLIHGAPGTAQVELAERSRVVKGLTRVAHDVSDELRDPDGEWTKGSGTLSITGKSRAVARSARSRGGSGKRRIPVVHAEDVPRRTLASTDDLPDQAIHFVSRNAKKFYDNGGRTLVVTPQTPGAASLVSEAAHIYLAMGSEDTATDAEGRADLAHAVHAFTRGNSLVVALDRNGHLAAAIDFTDNDTDLDGGWLGSSHLAGSAGAPNAVQHAFATLAASRGMGVVSMATPRSIQMHQGWGRKLGVDRQSIWTPRDCQKMSQGVTEMTGVNPDITGKTPVPTPVGPLPAPPGEGLNMREVGYNISVKDHRTKGVAGAAAPTFAPKTAAEVRRYFDRAIQEGFDSPLWEQSREWVDAPEDKENSEEA